MLLTSIRVYYISFQLRAWFLPLTFTLIFGSLLVKSWRVRRIFEGPPSTRVVGNNLNLLCLTLSNVVQYIQLYHAYCLNPFAPFGFWQFSGLGSVFLTCPIGDVNNNQGSLNYNLKRSIMVFAAPQDSYMF